MAKWDSNLKLLLLTLLLLSDIVHTRAPFPQNIPRPSVSSQMPIQEVEDTLHFARELVLNLSASLEYHIEAPGNASCADLANGGWRGSAFHQELLALVMVSVLVSAGCLFEAQYMIMQLYTLLGEKDTESFLQDIVILVNRGKEKGLAHTNSFHSTVMQNSESQRHLQAVLFNINQLAEVDESANVGRCKKWLLVKGTRLLGKATEQSKSLTLEEAKEVCGRMGIQCAGVSHQSGSYLVILRPGSRMLPSTNSVTWILDCTVGPLRWRRNGVPQHRCVNEKEERVYTVVEWIPAISTLYNLGTAVYYASVNCYDTAKERAIYSTLDLGTDALMAVTGGTVGVAGYALGAGVKTGVKAGIKYLLNSMKEEADLLMNQNSWEDASLTAQ